MVVHSESYPCRRELVTQYVEKKCQELQKKTKQKAVPESLATDSAPLNEAIRHNPRYSTELMEKMFRETAKHFKEAQAIGEQINSLNQAVKNLNNFKGRERLERQRRVRGETSSDLSVQLAEEITKSESECQGSEFGSPFSSKLAEEREEQEISELFNNFIAQNNHKFSGLSCSPVSIASPEEFQLFGRLKHDEFGNFHEHVKIFLQEHENKPSDSSKDSPERLKAGEVKKKRKITFFKPQEPIKEKDKKSLVPECPQNVKQILERAKDRRANAQRKVQIPVSVVNLQLI